jgi:hypothetical protein
MRGTAANLLRIAVGLPLFALAGAALGATAADAQSRDDSPVVVPVVIGDGPGTLIPLVLQSANLTGAQRAQAMHIVETEGPPIRDRLKEIARIDVALAQELFSAGAPRAEELSRLTKRIADLRRDIADREIAILSRIRGILGPEQLAAVTVMDQELWKSVHQQPPTASLGSAIR